MDAAADVMGGGFSKGGVVDWGVLSLVECSPQLALLVF